MLRSLTFLILTAVGVFIFTFFSNSSNNLPVIAIANYGPHSSLEETIRGIKDGMAKHGYIEGKTISYEIADVNFDTSLIMQTLSKLVATKPKVIVAISTPIAQAAKNNIHDIPVIFMDVTDPVAAGLLKKYDMAEKNITGASDAQDLNLVLKFAKKLSPNINRVGILYSTGEANDVALVEMMQKAANNAGMQFFAVAVDSNRDVPVRMYKFKDSVDMIYVGSSGAIQPSLPTIVSIAEEMKIPVFNVNGEEVKEGKVFASFGVTYYKIGINGSKLINKVLKGHKVKDLAPIYPSIADHEAFISSRRAQKINFLLPKFLPKYAALVQ